MRRFFWQLRLSDVLIGLAVMGLLLFVYGNSLWQLWHQGGQFDVFAFLREPYLHHVLSFSFYQAFLSTLLSVGLGLLLAHAFFYQTFFAKEWLLRLFSLTMVLPVLVVIFGLLGVYGKSGWLATILAWFGVEQRPNIYGLSGILLAHVFFNAPLATRIFLQSLHAIPVQQRQLACQLGIVNTGFVRLIEWRYLRQHLLPVATLIFMLCFTSFTIVLTLGGGPKYTTLEVAIFQAVTFEFELGKASILALLQLVICFALFQLGSYLSRTTPTVVSQGQRWVMPLSMPYTVLQRLALVLMIAFALLPLLQVVISGLNIEAWQRSWRNPELWKALLFSSAIAPSAGLLSLLMTMALLLGARQFHWRGRINLATYIMNAGMMILAVPTLVLAVGLFLLLRQFTVGTPALFAIVVLCNALLTMPFAIRFLTAPFYNNMTHYEKLCQSLGLRGWQRWRLIEWQAISQPAKSAFALATALSLGDFTAIALFGNQNFTSLPRLLYQQLGQYRSREAGVTALILLLFCALIFLAVERYRDDTTQTTPL